MQFDSLVMYKITNESLELTLGMREWEGFCTTNINTRANSNRVFDHQI